MKEIKVDKKLELIESSIMDVCREVQAQSDRIASIEINTAHHTKVGVKTIKDIVSAQSYALGKISDRVACLESHLPLKNQYTQAGYTLSNSIESRVKLLETRLYRDDSTVIVDRVSLLESKLHYIENNMYSRAKSYSKDGCCCIVIPALVCSFVYLIYILTH